MLTKRLKDDNWALHQIAERQETPGSLIKGQMPREGYVGMIAQQVLINRVLDDAMRGAIKSDPRVGELVLEEQMLSPYLIEDAAYFGLDLDAIEPNPGTARFIEHIGAHKDQPLHLLGLHYVRLGACNGNRFVARVVRKAYELGEEGTRYLDPFGETQRDKWMEFKNALDAMPFDEAEQDQVFDGTRAAYVAAINLDLDEAMSAEALLEQHGKTLDKKAFEEGHSVHVPSPHG
ncbi:MAG: biliverdin-producing heme oxygenase [Phycisphaerales bacterium]|nr:biliverdin-producing heme oxygenase [Phycisphaerales bacterium]